MQASPRATGDMIALHAIWTGRALHLWGEESASPRSGVRRRPAKHPQPRAHPFAAGIDRLREATVGLGVSTSLTGAVEDRLTLVLPSLEAGPMPSPQLIRDDDTGSETSGRKVHLAPWTIPSLVLSPAEALEFLCALPGAPPSDIALGASARYWAEAARFVLELLARQQFLPGFETGDPPRATWRPVLADGGVSERSRLLASAMPPVCCAAWGDGETPRPSWLLDSFVESTLDATIRRALTGSRFLATLRRQGVARGGATPRGVARQEVARQEVARASIAQRWLAALIAEEPVVAGSPKELAALAETLNDWTGRIEEGRADGAFRTCFRLTPPDGDGEAAARGMRQRAGAWTVTFHLQARDDPSLLVDAATVWRERSDTLTYLRRRFHNPQERLLADLGRAARLFPKLEDSLRSPRPEACALRTEEAYQFLREAVPLFEQSGLGVLVPPWWQKVSAKPGVRLKLSSKDAAAGAAGGFGLETLVEFQWEVALGTERLLPEEFEQLAKLKLPLVQVRGQWVELRPEDVEAAIRFFREKRTGEMSLADALRLGLAADDSRMGLPVVGIETEGWLSGVLGDMEAGARLYPVEPPRSFHGRLRPYQVRGLSWLAFLDRFGLGACLADDMGLGKTIQMLALLLHERESGPRPGPTLIVCPMSVVGNWQREVERFAPGLRAMVHHGTERLSGRAFAREAAKHDVVISTYALVHRDRESLAATRWHRIALDEAQNIKNSAAKQAQAVRSLQTNHRVALTGTPVENRLSDLWSIMEFLNPGYLGSAGAFRRSFAVPIERYRDPERAERLRRIVGPFVLRRLKTDRAIITDLPEKLEMRVLCNLTREQASLYEAVVRDMVKAIRGTEGIQRKGLVLATLTRLKQVCNHPAQFLQDGSALAGRSGKLARIEEMLDEVIAAGHRALVFTQFAEMGGMLKRFLQERLGREVLFLHGGTLKPARDAMVARFQSDGGAPPVFILSLKAGGFGLNLTAASHVFHFDRWWNPAVENQATDRAFRIGQRKNVQVHKYVCVGTLEERIDLMLEQKKGLADRVIGAGEGWITELSTEELKDLFALSKEAVAED